MKTMLARQLEATLADPERLLARAAFADDLIALEVTAGGPASHIAGHRARLALGLALGHAEPEGLGPWLLLVRAVQELIDASTAGPESQSLRRLRSFVAENADLLPAEPAFA